VTERSFQSWKDCFTSSEIGPSPQIHRLLNVSTPHPPPSISPSQKSKAAGIGDGGLGLGATESLSNKALEKRNKSTGVPQAFHDPTAFIGDNRALSEKLIKRIALSGLFELQSLTLHIGHETMNLFQ
jgi:hypothetical protein